MFTFLQNWFNKMGMKSEPIPPELNKKLEEKERKKKAKERERALRAANRR